MFLLARAKIHLSGAGSCYRTKKDDFRQQATATWTLTTTSVTSSPPSISTSSSPTSSLYTLHLYNCPLHLLPLARLQLGCKVDLVTATIGGWHYPRNQAAMQRQYKKSNIHNKNKQNRLKLASWQQPSEVVIASATDTESRLNKARKYANENFSYQAKLSLCDPKSLKKSKANTEYDAKCKKQAVASGQL